MWLVNAEAVLRIKEAEERGSASVAEAEKRCADIVSQTKADCDLLIKRAQSEAEKLISDVSEAASRKGTKLESEAEGLAISESGILRKQAADKMDEAVRMIVWGIIGKWQ